MVLLRKIAMRAPELVGSPWAFLGAILLTSAWLVWGVFARWSATWLLWPSAIASAFTFLIVFSLQYTQNRDTRTLQVKLDEILRAHENARTALVKVERRTDDELAQIEGELLELRDEDG